MIKKKAASRIRLLGAWIETQFMLYRKTKKIVAPCMGAWIETKLF